MKSYRIYTHYYSHTHQCTECFILEWGNTLVGNLNLYRLRTRTLLYTDSGHEHCWLARRLIKAVELFISSTLKLKKEGSYIRSTQQQEEYGHSCRAFPWPFKWNTVTQKVEHVNVWSVTVTAVTFSCYHHHHPHLPHRYCCVENVLRSIWATYGSDGCGDDALDDQDPYWWGWQYY